MSIDNIEQATDFIYSSYLKAERFLDYDLPDKFKRNPEFTRQIIDRLNCHVKPNIIVTGSKGKGSVSIMISAILRTHFPQVGLFTSPHILKLNERIRINDRLINDSDFIRYINRIYPYVREIDRNQPQNRYVSPIGILAVAALLFFKENGTDINIFECGKGALYDDVNIIQSDYSVINTIFLEHTRELGKSIEEIAENKSAAVKVRQICSYTARQPEEVLKIISNRAQMCKVLLKQYGEDFYCSDVAVSEMGTVFDVHTKHGIYDGIRLRLLGEHQAENCALALAVCEDICGRLDRDAVKEALVDLSWPGRMEIIGHDPLTVLDACINAGSARFVKRILASMHSKDIITVVGIPQDKDYEGVIREISGISSKIILTTSANPHYKFSGEQLVAARKYNKDSIFVENAENALVYARKAAGSGGVLCILGTTALVSDVKRLYTDPTRA